MIVAEFKVAGLETFVDQVLNLLLILFGDVILRNEGGFVIRGWVDVEGCQRTRFINFLVLLKQVLKVFRK